MLGEVAREWGRIGLTGFGGPPAHIVLLRDLVVERRRWIEARDFEDANAACQLLPGPASTQLAIYCAARVAGRPGALIGGLCFVLPAVLAVLALSLLFFAGAPPDWVRGAGAGAAAAVAAVAVQAGLTIVRPAWGRLDDRDARARFALYLVLGAAAAAIVGVVVVVVLLACGVAELARRRLLGGTAAVALLPLAVASGGMLALAWTSFKVGALSYGGGFVIVPLMQHDAVDVNHWMTDTQFANAVALGQITPGPVTATITAVGYAAHGVGGAALASAIAFAPSFAFIRVGAERFDTLRANPHARAFLDGAGPAAAGAILGAAIPLALVLEEGWQAAILAAAAVALLLLQRSVVLTLVAAGAVGALVALAGGPLP
ncbi:MAG TPA: chromate efflux transporter [Solirubrobacteraceae bacterium]